MAAKSKYDIASRRIKKRNEFRAHLVSYLVIIGFLFVLNILTSPGYLWAIWPALGWGIGLAFHGFEAAGIIADKDQEKEMIEAEVRRMERKESEEYLEEEEDPLELKEIQKEYRYDEDDFV